MINPVGIFHLKQHTYILSILLLAGSLFANQALALVPEASINDYHHQTWSRKDGAPADIRVLAQTDDGWMWLGTNYGLYRFDGLHFERYQSPSGKQPAGTRVSFMGGAPGNELVVGYLDGGLDIIRDGEIVDLPSRKNIDVGIVWTVAPDFDGSVWIGTTNGMFRYSDGDVRKIGAEWQLPVKFTKTATVDPYGQLWARVDGRWYKLDRQNRRFVPTERTEEAGLFYAPDGGIWWQRGALLIRDTSDEGPPSTARRESRRHYTGDSPYMFDDAGNLWTLESPKGIARIRRADLSGTGIIDPRLLPAEPFAQPGETSNPHPADLLEDREGNIWVRSSEGIERFRNQRIRNLPIPDGTSNYRLTADGQGRIWASASNLGDVWDIGHAPPPALSPKRNIIPAVGRDGALLRAGPAGIERHGSGKRQDVIPLPPQCHGSTPDDVIQMAEDKASLWATIFRCGSFRYNEGSWQDFKSLGLLSSTRVMEPDRAGAMWLANTDGQVQRHLDGKVTDYSLADGGTLGAIRFIDTRQDIFVSGATGSAVVRNGRLWRVTGSIPDALRTLAGMVILPNGDHWLHTSLGMARVRAADWNASMRDLRVPLRMEMLDSADGYTGSPNIMNMLANGALDAAGRIWFATTSVIGTLDPARDYRNAIPPTVQITSVSSGQHSYFPGKDILLPARPGRVDVSFAAVSLSMPERMQVWYKLDGVDEAWQLAGTRRSASYSNLGPGRYHFAMKAVTRDGVWSERDASLDFEVQPAFTQTLWFYLMCAALVAAAGYLLYLLRMRQVVRRMNALLSERLLERERIARALHDSWIQDVQGLVLSVDGVSKSLPDRTPARVRLEEVLARADHVLTDGRNAVMGLRTTAILANDVEQIFAQSGARLQREHGPAFSLRRSGAQRPLDRAAWEDVYFIGHEALINAYRHAGAQRITLTLEYGAEHFTLSIRDDGIGIPAQVLQDGGKEGHWGLTGLRERAHLLHGAIAIASPPAGGTEIRLSVPGVRVYVAEMKPTMLARIRARLARKRMLKSTPK
ncbi:sensor histidine kinase [Duganella callida]|nr:sensor histidine kinase [Duganella callida]